MSNVNTSRLPVVVVLGMLAFGATAVGAGADPRREAADPWLDRAVAELPGVRREDEQVRGDRDSFSNLMSETQFALMLFQCRQTDADRARLVELARRSEKTPPRDETPVERFRPVSEAALLYAVAGAKDDARRLLPAVEKAGADVKGLGSIIVPAFVMIIRAQLGGLTDADLAKRSPTDLALLMTFAAGEDKPADVARYAALARRAAGKPDAKNASAHNLLAVRLAECGQTAAAFEVAGGIPPASYHRAGAFARIAEVLHAAGDAAGRTRALREGLKSTAGPAEGYDRLPAHSAVLHTAIDIGDKEVMSAAADAFSAELDRGAPMGHGDSVAYRATIATGYALAGRRADFARAITAAEAALAKASKEEQPAYWVKIATAHARTGDKAGAQAAMARSKSAGEVRDMDSYEFEDLAAAYARAGDFDTALAAARQYLPKPKDRTSTLFRIARLQSQAGHYADAERTAGEMDDAFKKFVIHRTIVIERTKSGKTAGLLEWINAHPTARERAGLHLAVAQHLLGKEGKGNARVFRGPA